MLRLSCSLLIGVSFVRSQLQCSESNSKAQACYHSYDDSRYRRSAVAERAELGPALLQTKYAGLSSPNTEFFEEEPINQIQQDSQQIVAEPPLPPLPYERSGRSEMNPIKEPRNDLAEGMFPMGDLADVDIDQRSPNELEQSANLMARRAQQYESSGIDQRSPNELEQSANLMARRAQQYESSGFDFRQAPPLTGSNDPDAEIEEIVDQGPATTKEPDVEKERDDEVKEKDDEMKETKKHPKVIEERPVQDFPEYSPEIKVGEWIPQKKQNHCNPQCTWSCNIPKCDEVCTPVCQAPKCETRCNGMSTDGCVMSCAKPHCMVMCSKRDCPAGGCPSCKTQCSQPECHMKCPKSKLCKSVCEHPKCEWNCKAPSCPKPRCHMVCESSKKCNINSPSFSQELPPLQPGQTAVQTFVAKIPSEKKGDDSTPMSLLQSASDFQELPWTVPSSMDVNVRSMFGEPMIPQTNMVTMPVHQEQAPDSQPGVYWGAA